MIPKWLVAGNGVKHLDLSRHLSVIMPIILVSWNMLLSSSYFGLALIWAVAVRWEFSKMHAHLNLCRLLFYFHRVWNMASAIPATTSLLLGNWVKTALTGHIITRLEMGLLKMNGKGCSAILGKFGVRFHHNMTLGLPESRLSWIALLYGQVMLLWHTFVQLSILRSVLPLVIIFLCVCFASVIAMFLLLSLISGSNLILSIII